MAVSYLRNTPITGQVVHHSHGRSPPKNSTYTAGQEPYRAGTPHQGAPTHAPAHPIRRSPGKHQGLARTGARFTPQHRS